MLYVLVIATIVPLAAILWLAARRQLGRGPKAFVLWMLLFLPMAMLILRLASPASPLWVGVILGVLLGPLAFLRYYSRGGDGSDTSPR